MSYDPAATTIEAVLATMHRVPQPPAKGFTDKFAVLSTDEAIHMLATYCFDLERKLEYLTKVARPFAEHIPADLAQEIQNDTNEINKDGLNWEQRAKVAHDIMQRLHKEHEAMLQTAS
jgi:hypothetical protein